MLKKLFALLLLTTVTTPAYATAEYDACYQKARNDNEVALCMKAENTRLLREVQQIYLNLSKQQAIKKWNNGNGLISGNLKDMYNSWLAYRNRYCSLYVVASQNTFGGESFDRERCLLSFTNDHYELIKTVIINLNSGGEEDDTEE